MKPISWLFLLLCFPLLTIAQSTYQINGVKVIQHGDTLRNAWVGGFNNPEFSPIDLNQDGLMDMFVYDKAGWKALSFINTGSIGHPSFTYAPEYDRMYPKSLNYWAVIRDYNHDGIGDIYAYNHDGVMVYKGSRNGNTLSYTLMYNQLKFSEGAFTSIIATGLDNMPVIADIDGSGQMDILAPDQNTVTLDYFKNVAVDSGYSADSLYYILVSQCWGNFAEDFTDCNVELGKCSPDHSLPPTGASSARGLRHNGGACWGFHYVPDSHVTSLFIADIYCNTTKFLQNTGDTITANITYVDTLFPSYDRPVDMALFPAVYGFDVDNDGFEDLLVAPFASNTITENQSEDINVVRYYHNDANPDSLTKFHYEGDTLLNNSMVDVGSESHPVFFDYNGDGLMDIVIGRYGQFLFHGDSLPGTSICSLELYENIGTDTMPVFQLVDTDWNGLSALHDNGLYPAFGDLDGDGLPDMVVGDVSGKINFYHNTGTVAQASYHSITGPNWFGISMSDNAAPFIYDVNRDGLYDLIIGSGGVIPSTTSSDIYYYWNFGTPTHPLFSPDSVNSFFGKIVVWDSSQGVVEGYPTPTIVKENGKLMLYAGSQRGITFKFEINTDSLRSGSFMLVDSDVLGVKPGLRSNVSVADINHDGKNDYITGNVRGGIMLFSDAPWSSSSTDAINNIVPDKNQLEIFPNPSKDKVVCRLSDAGATLVSAQLFDLLGEPISVPINKQGADEMLLSVGGVAEGIYIIQASDSQGHLFQNKISIFR